MTTKRSQQEARMHLQRLDRHVAAIAKENGGIPSADFLYQELVDKRKLNLTEIFGINRYNIVRMVEQDCLEQWLFKRKEHIPLSPEARAAFEKRQKRHGGKKGKKQSSLIRSYPNDGTKFVPLIAVLVEASRDPDAPDFTERQRKGRETIAALVARYRELGGPYLAVADLLIAIDEDVEKKRVQYEQPEMPLQEFVA